MVLDPFTNGISLILNSSASKKKSVKIPNCKLSLKFVSLLYKEGFIQTYSNNSKKILVVLKYDEYLRPCLKKITILSKSGSRFYSSMKSLGKIKNNVGIVISTSKGLMMSNKAKSSMCGGELLCILF